MSKIRSTDEPIGRMAKLMAALYTHMAREMIDQLGEIKGQQSVKRAIKNFADQRISSMLEEADELGLPVNDETYTKVRDMPGTPWIKDDQHPADILYCPMYAMWHQQNADELAALYCEIDSYLFKAFNTEMERPLCLSSGDDRCRFLLKPIKE